MKLTLSEVANALDADGLFDPQAMVSAYSIDSRTIEPGQLFFAITGERFDAHNFVRDVIAKGAYAVISAARAAAEFSGLHGILVVPDPLAAMQRLGNHVRDEWGKRVIGLTGSAGKTTTKDATATVLSARFNVFKSAGNLNNHFGVPLQLLRLEPEHDVAVIEMGMNHAGEIAALCHIAEPDWAIITNVGTAHAGNFPDGIEGVSRAKFELIENTKPNGVIILNGDDERVRLFGTGYQGRVLRYGLNHDCDVRAVAIDDQGALGTSFDLLSRTGSTNSSEKVRTHLPLIGRHNLMNALAAAAAGIASGIPLSDVSAALSRLTPGDKRGEVIRYAVDGGGHATLINDTYNSNPKALKAMVEALKGVPAKRHLVVAGEMLELGDGAAEMHRECGAYIASAGVDLTIGVRGEAKALVEAVSASGAVGTFVATPQEAGELLSRNLRDGDAVLLKGSRGVRLEGAIAVLQGTKV